MAAHVLSEPNLCATAKCRNEVADVEGAAARFVKDSMGTRWKCVDRTHMVENFGRGFACAELDCRVGEYTMLSQESPNFRGSWRECKEPDIVATVDGRAVLDAPRDGSSYGSLSQLTTCSGGMAPPIAPVWTSFLDEDKQKRLQSCSAATFL
eukprot:gnl/MRDRNA2_/MRDRNA2_104878_c0_seq1.p1 gnl/MRDRNA2_/MRDRNA2_104878_c0~~gnl/MRDRNA2_/MRDRNA2_104878_c0_seq1.p1  ORF type:complete len:161 (-),score=24.38 gnl/MRDRNA2_/MRDRNA2_104878_c0_seq1:2-457(-)